MGDAMEDAGQAQANEVVKALKGPLQEAIRRVERLSEDFPAEKDFHFYNNFPQFKTPVKGIQAQAEALLNDIGMAKRLRPETSRFPSDGDESYDWLVAVQDDLVEGIDAAVDLLNKETAAGKRRSSVEGYQTPMKWQRGDGSPSDSAKVSKGSSERRPVPFHVRSIPRPQNKFDVVVDNSNTPFKHPQVAKPDAKTEGLSALDLHARRLGVTFEDMHPLEEELTKMDYLEEKMLEAPVPQKPRPIEETPLTVVSTLSELHELAAKCRAAGEIAVDLENHQYRSFQGFVCLMQISTRSEDFIVDTLALRSHMSSCLKDIFADSKIRKVMHGADHDIVWLQRDFGIYVCNMFDTGQAARVLQLEGFGLAFLMQRYLEINPDKRYQLADWRIRPLPEEMIKYAREDTHYLLYLHDLLRVQLVSLRSETGNDVDDPLLQVYKRSRDVCLKMYHKDILTETSHLSLYGLQDRQLTPEQMSVLAGLYAWRDKLARKLDESTGFVLPNQLLFKLAEEMPDSARTLQAIIRGPHSLVGLHVAEVVEVIKQSKEKAVVSDPNTSVSVPEQSETKSTPVTQASNDPSAEMGIASRTTTQVAKMVTETSVPKPMEEDTVPASADFADVEMKLTTIVDRGAQEVLRSVDSKVEKAQTTSIKEITMGPSMSAQVMVKQSSIEDNSPASTINIRKQNVAVVKRASGPSLALFGGGSKKKGSARTVDSNTETKAVETSLRTVTLNPVIDSEASKLACESLQLSKLPNPVVQAIPESLTLTSVSKGDGIEASAEAVPPVKCISLAEDKLSGAAVGSGEAVQPNVSDVTPMDLEGESKSAAAAEALSHDSKSLEDAGRCNEVSPAVTATPLSGSCSGEDVVMVAAEGEKASDIKDVKLVDTKSSPGSSTALEARPGSEGVIVRRASGATRQGLGSMLGSASHRKRQKKSTEDMEMVAAKMRADRIQASVSLPFHRVPSLDEHQLEGLSGQEAPNPIPADQGSELANSSPSQPISPTKTKSAHLQEAAPYEELGDFVMIGNMESAPRRRSANDVATKNRSNWSKQFATEEEVPLPETLSEMRRKPKHEGKSHQHPGDSSTRKPKRSALSSEMVNVDNPAEMSSRSQHQNSNSPANMDRSDVEANEEPVVGETVFQPFDYDTARREIGLGENLVSRKEDSETGRGRGRGRPVNPNKRQKQVAPPSTNGPVQPFDPLRRARQEPRPEGIPAAKRRQVFPQTGNRTASFRR
ncbi:hypothetical protein KC19_4G021800 [Ceratodon purpureus]|uniref:HRDC domain-containing protein n=1 Tax=Ceratodon purpureus TaxID=3225 RepID=A0A8T0I5Q8_CERPU|nr:hypothetical protein KC19_4G021800 [Ceratodon purpureus]